MKTTLKERKAISRLRGVYDDSKLSGIEKDLKKWKIKKTAIFSEDALFAAKIGNYWYFGKNYGGYVEINLMERYSGSVEKAKLGYDIARTKDQIIEIRRTLTVEGARLKSLERQHRSMK